MSLVSVHSLEYTVRNQSLPARDCCDGVDGPLPIHRLQHVYRQLVFISNSLWEAVTGRHECCGDSKVQQKEYAWKSKKAKARERRYYCHALSQDDGCKVARYKTFYHSDSSAWQHLHGGHRQDKQEKGNQSRNHSLYLTVTKVWGGEQNGPAACILLSYVPLSLGI